jgi:hypothetical protein
MHPDFALFQLNQTHAVAVFLCEMECCCTKLKIGSSQAAWVYVQVTISPGLKNLALSHATQNSQCIYISNANCIAVLLADFGTAANIAHYAKPDPQQQACQAKPDVKDFVEKGWLWSVTPETFFSPRIRT